MPSFRHVDIGMAAPLEPITGTIKLLTDQEFPPYSFQSPDGTMAGLSVDLALRACAELKLTCQVVAKPFAELLPALKRGEGDVIVSGLRMVPEILNDAESTRPYFFSLGRFAVRAGMPFTQPDVRALAGRRVGYVKGTSHGAFLEKYYDRAALTPFENEAAMFDALRTASVDVAFSDALHVSFWLKGTSSRSCCMVLGGSIIDRATFSRSLSFLVRGNEPNLREALDYALDRLEDKGISQKIFMRYLPESPF